MTHSFYTLSRPANLPAHQCVPQPGRSLNLTQELNLPHLSLTPHLPLSSWRLVGGAQSSNSNDLIFPEPVTSKLSRAPP